MRRTEWYLPNTVVTATVPCGTVFTDDRISTIRTTAPTISAIWDALMDGPPLGHRPVA